MIDLPHARRVPVRHAEPREETGDMQGDLFPDDIPLRVRMAGYPGRHLTHFFIRVVFSRNDQGRQLHVATLHGAGYEIRYRFPAARQLLFFYHLLIQCVEVKLDV